MSFESDVRRFAVRARNGADKLTRAAELALFSGTILDTPVDEGRLRGNWQYSHGAPINEQLPEGIIDKQGAATVAKAKAGVMSAPWPRKSYLRNNLPYAIPIEEGHSTVKAPQGMLRRNLRRVVANLRAEIRRLR